MSQKAKQESTEAPSALRFQVMLRVDYTLKNRSTFAYAAAISTRDLVLRAKDFPEGESFELKLGLGAKPVSVSAMVAGTLSQGLDAGVTFVFDSGQEAALKQIRKYIEQQCVSKLEEAVSRSVRAVDKVLDLAAWYA